MMENYVVLIETYAKTLDTGGSIPLKIEAKSGYFHSKHPWTRVPKDTAERLSWKRASSVARHLRVKIGYDDAVIEKVDK